MSPEQFKAWRTHMKFSQAKAAEALGLSPETVGNYDLGRRRDGGETKIPKVVELACAAIALGLTSYSGPNERPVVPGSLEQVLGRRLVP